MKVQNWIAWYTEGRIFYSEDISWEELPNNGILFIMLYLDTFTLGGRQYPMSDYKGEGIQYRREMKTFDWFFKQGDLYGFNNLTLEENKKIYPNASFKRGIWITDDEFNNIQKEARSRVIVKPCNTCN